MPTSSGLTTFGIIRRRMSDLYVEFANRLREGGAFGTQTTVDAPDTFPSDPLVQIATAASASAHELWEAVELWFTQLDLDTASGVYLERLHGARVGIARPIGMIDDEYRRLIQAAVRTRPTRTDPVSVASGVDGVTCAKLLLSTTAAPIDGIPAPGAMLVINGCAIDYQALAQAMYDNVELGLYNWIGDRTVGYSAGAGSCVSYTFQEAQPLFAALDIRVQSTASCGAVDLAAIRTAAVEALTVRYGACSIGGALTRPMVISALSGLPDLIIGDVKMARRARVLTGNGCDPAGLPTVTVCGASTVWATSITCGPSAGEVWCEPEGDCLNLQPWEYLAFDPQFVTVTLDNSLASCA